VIKDYIADFYCASAKLIVEIDGAQHYNEENAKKDRIRDEFFNSIGLSVVRYTNYDVDRNFEGVCTDLLRRMSLNWDDIKPRLPR
jgi:very-short-patch-repair endonuclease